MAGTRHPAAAASLPGSTEADVCIVGAGYTGLWTAYYLNRADPALRIVVLEASFAGYGASGRNGGWVTAELPGSRARYARHPRGQDGVRDLEQHLRDTVDEVARVCAAEGIEASLVKGGTLTVATSAAQEARLRHRLEQERAWGDDARIVRYLEKTELDDRLQVAGAVGALYSPHCARVQPADLVAGLAETVTRAGRPALRGHPGDVDIGRAGPHPGRRRARTLYRALHRGVHRGHPGPAPDAAADEQLDDRHRPARRRGLEIDRLGSPRDARRRGARVHVRAAHRGRPDRARRPRRPVPLRLRGGPRRRDRGVHHRAARPDPAPDVPGRGRGRPGARVVRRARRAEGLVRHGHPGPRGPAWAGRAATRATGWPHPTWPAGRSPT